MKTIRIQTVLPLFIGWLGSLAAGSAAVPTMIEALNTNGQVQVHLSWPAEADRQYDILTSTNLGDCAWWLATPNPIAPTNLIGDFRLLSTNRTQFFRVAPRDTQGPAITYRYPATNDIGVDRFATLSLSLTDETGVDPSRSGLTFNGVTFTNGSAGVTATSNSFQYVPGTNAWGDYGATAAVSFVCADVLGNTTTSAWNFTLSVTSAPSGMALIPAGSFEMGDALGDCSLFGSCGYERPVHTVYVSAFYMDRMEVTKTLWDEVYQWAITHGYSFEYGAQGKAADHPAHNMTWYDAVKWCNARSQREGRSASYYTDSVLTQVYKSGEVAPYVKWNAGYRLPTEAEWEKAARGGLSGKRFPWGDTISHSQANYWSSWDYSYDISPTYGHHPAYQNGDYPYTSPAGSFAPNGYGLYDMAGNVWEWCWDWWGDSYYSTSAGTDPKGPSGGSLRVSRGGSWYGDARGCRAAYRNYGLRLAYGVGYSGIRSVLPPGLCRATLGRGNGYAFAPHYFVGFDSRATNHPAAPARS